MLMAYYRSRFRLKAQVGADGAVVIRRQLIYDVNRRDTAVASRLWPSLSRAGPEMLYPLCVHRVARRFTAVMAGKWGQPDVFKLEGAICRRIGKAAVRWLHVSPVIIAFSVHRRMLEAQKTITKSFVWPQTKDVIVDKSMIADCTFALLPNEATVFNISTTSTRRRNNKRSRRRTIALFIERHACRGKSCGDKCVPQPTATLPRVVCDSQSSAQPKSPTAMQLLHANTMTSGTPHTAAAHCLCPISRVMFKR